MRSHALRTTKTRWWSHVAQCRHPDGGRKTAQSAWRTTHDSKRNRGAGHARLDGARPSSLVPRSPFLRPRSSFLVPPSLRLSVRDGCLSARHKTTGAVSDANKGGARAAAAFTPAAPTAAAWRGGCAGCAAATTGRDRDRGRAPPASATRPPRHRARPRGAPSKVDSTSRPRRTRAPLEVELLQVSCRKRSGRAVRMRAPRRRSSPPHPAFTKPPPRPPSTIPLQQRRSRFNAASVRVRGRQWCGCWRTAASLTPRPALRLRPTKVRLRAFSCAIRRTRSCGRK